MTRISAIVSHPVVEDETAPEVFHDGLAYRSVGNAAGQIRSELVITGSHQADPVATTMLLAFSAILFIKVGVI